MRSVLFRDHARAELQELHEPTRIIEGRYGDRPHSSKILVKLLDLAMVQLESQLSR